MVRVRKRRLGGNTYYYLEHGMRDGGRIRKKERYVGRTLPPNMDEIMQDFVHEIYNERWRADIDTIRKNFAKERRIMPKTVREKEIRSFAVRFTYDTQKIEGSTLTRREVADLLEKGITPKNRPMTDVQEAELHNKLFHRMLGFKGDLTLQLLLDWHWDLFGMTKPDIAGDIRRYRVGITGSEFVPPSPYGVRPMLAEMFEWYESNKSRIHPVMLAALVHLKIVTIHPFGDGNGRITRLAMNFILNRNKYPMLDIPYEGRSGYYNSLERAQVGKDELAFLQWFAKKYIKAHSAYL